MYQSHAEYVVVQDIGVGVIEHFLETAVSVMIMHVAAVESDVNS